MDDDPVLRSLGEDLARDDPRLAALLSGDGRTARPGRGAWAVFLVILLTPVVVTVAVLVPPTVVLGIVAMALAVASPLVVCWLCAGDRPAPRLR
ncbi:DUF3040 domain-containing protein [Blastococcus deserti]|uniref:DUF3040 domain-containing protein n=1 Tax=Blastococcus deserti TaxID=2259033 RepID=A0ABW4X736_9ACTN